jgi:RNA polymerase primary sigma factor
MKPDKQTIQAAISLQAPVRRLRERQPHQGQGATEQLLRSVTSEDLGRLLPGEQTIVKLRFGLEGNRRHSRAELAKRFSVRPVNIERLELRALAKLAQLKNEGPPPAA